VFSISRSGDFILEERAFDPAFLQSEICESHLTHRLPKKQKEYFPFAVNCPLSYPREQSSVNLRLASLPDEINACIDFLFDPLSSTEMNARGLT